MVNLRSLDLNLLVILDTLLEEAHVSRAAARLGLSQPATSNALERCRSLFADRLLERQAGAMRRTARGEALREPLRLALAAVAQVVASPEPSLAEIRQSVSLRMADAIEGAVLGSLLRSLGADAPGLDLIVKPWRDASQDIADTASGRIDVAVAPLSAMANGNLLICHQFSDPFQLAMRAGHPFTHNPSLENWLTQSHLVVSARGSSRTQLDDRLAASGSSRRVGLTVPSFVTVSAILRDSDLVALVPSLALKGEQGRGLAFLPPPIEVQDLELAVAIERRRETDVAVRFVADRLIEVLKLLQG